jgi:outer membrane protein assembly factor BamB
MRRLLTAVLVVSLTSSTLADDNWPRFRGPNGSGLSDLKGLPTTWTEKDYRWSVDLPGTGNSSPVVWGDRLFVTAANEEKLERFLLCYSTRDGKLLWSHGLPFTAEKKHKHNSYATSTPAVDADRIYAFWQSREASQLLAYDHRGTLLWSHDVGPYKVGHGGGISPIVVDGVVALNLNHEGDSCMLGVDAATGKQKWRVPRDAVRASYSTPCVYTDAAGHDSLIFTSWKHGFTAVDTQSGSVLWEIADVFGRNDEEDKRSIGSPFVAGGMIYGNCGFVGGKKYMAALKPNADSVNAPPETVFRVERNVNHMPTGIAVNGLLFLWSDAGIVVCTRADSGKEIWTERIGGNFSSSPVCIDGKLYCISDEGEAVVIAAADKFEELGRTMLDEGTSATPAVAGDALYLRTVTKLHALPAK